MTFDPKTNTVRLTSEKTSGLTAIGSMFLRNLRDDAALPGAPEDLVNDWMTVEAFLGCRGRDLTESDYKLFGEAFRSYTARGVAPSEDLQPAFNAFSAWVEEEKSPLIDISDELVQVFGRLLADDARIRKKKLADDIRQLSMQPLSSTRAKSPVGPALI